MSAATLSSSDRSAGPTRGLEPTARVQFLPGVGPKRAIVFERLGLVTVEDLIRHYPRQYIDASRFVSIKELVPGTWLTVKAQVASAAALRTRVGRTDFMMAVKDGTGTLSCYFFGQPFLARTLRAGAQVVVSGIFDPFERRMLNPMFEVVEGEVATTLHAGRMVPVHALTKGLTARGMRQAVRRALDAAAARVTDPVPDDVARALDLAPLAESLEQIHFPESAPRLERARERLVFEELFLLQSVLEIRRAALDQTGRGLATAGDGALAARAIQSLPFELTSDQTTALAEIVADLSSPRPMHRLLLGDVGSGKTVVAFLAALHVLEAGHQAAFMAPTEILARQHAATLERLGQDLGVGIALLTGTTPAAERRRLAARLAAGEPLLVVGTHALIEKDVAFTRLGLAIVDEQHRFGVRQRATLAQKGVVPDVLVLTATPIPRTLMLAFYRDLEVSRLQSRPEGRGRLVTRVTGESKRANIVEFMARELAAGRQAYVVVPVIDEGGTTSYRAAEAEHRRLAAEPALARFRVGLLHGRLKAEAKREVMEGFHAGHVHVLVATTVVEVGVDVANATLMVIENADRFGLTQLHQLRGRVGRGEHRSVCVLVPGPGASSLALERLDVVARTEDGFAIAEADLKMRGPGELWGMRQSGFARLRLADLARDEAILEQARAAAHGVVQADPLLDAKPNAALKATLLTNYREPLALALAG